MTFELTIHGDSPAELLAALQQLTTAPQETAEFPAKPKTTRRKENPKCTTVTTPAPSADAAATTASPAAPEPAAILTTSESGADAGGSTPDLSPQSTGSAPAAPADTSDAPDSSAQTVSTHKSPAVQATATASSDAAVPSFSTETALNEIRSLAFELMRAGKTPKVRAIVVATGAERISDIPPERYTEVWEKLLQLKDEVGKDAAD